MIDPRALHLPAIAVSAAAMTLCCDIAAGPNPAPLIWRFRVFASSFADAIERHVHQFKQEQKLPMKAKRAQ